MAKAKNNEVMSEGDAWKQISELFGENTVFHPEQMEQVETFTTRSPALDRALQVGGWSRGRVFQLAGAPSSGKTFMSLIGMVEWQSRDPENCVCFIDAEYTFDPQWFTSLGGDIDRVLLIKSNDGAKIFTGLVGTPKKNAKTGVVTRIKGLLDMIEAKQTIAHKVNGRTITLNLGKMGMIVLDSIAAISAPQELEAVVGKALMAPLSRFLTTELKKLTPAVAKANVVFIGINHVKTKIGEMFGNPETTPGGAAWAHACSVKLMVAPMSGEDNTLKDENDEKYGHRIRIRVDKNKVGKPGKKAEFFIDFTKGVTRRNEQLLDLGCLYGLIERPNLRSYIITGETLTSRELALEYVASKEQEIEELIREKYLNGETDITKADEVAIETPDDPFNIEVSEDEELPSYIDSE